MPGGKLGRDGKAEPAQLEFLSGKIWQHLARVHEFSLVLDTQPGPLKSILFFLVAKLALYFLLAEKDAPRWVSHHFKPVKWMLLNTLFPGGQ